MLKILILITSLMLSATFAWADDTKVLPNLGLKLQSLDYYDVSGGVIFENKPFALGSTVSLNHLRAGVDISEVVFRGDTLSTSALFFLRQRFMYFWSDKEAGNIHDIKGTAISNEIGVGISGCSPALTVFLGYAVPLSRGGNVVYAGIGMNL